MLPQVGFPRREPLWRQAGCISSSTPAVAADRGEAVGNADQSSARQGKIAPASASICAVLPEVETAAVGSAVQLVPPPAMQIVSQRAGPRPSSRPLKSVTAALRAWRKRQKFRRIDLVGSIAQRPPMPNAAPIGGSWRRALSAATANAARAQAAGRAWHTRWRTTVQCDAVIRRVVRAVKRSRAALGIVVDQAGDDCQLS